MWVHTNASVGKIEDVKKGKQTLAWIGINTSIRTRRCIYVAAINIITIKQLGIFSQA